MGLEGIIARAILAGFDPDSRLMALVAERDALKAENAFLKDQADARKVEFTDPVMRSAPSGHSCSEREIVNDRLAALESDAKTYKGASDSLVRRVAALQSRDILADQRMDHLDRRIDDFIARVDEIERAHLESAQ